MAPDTAPPAIDGGNRIGPSSSPATLPASRARRGCGVVAGAFLEQRAETLAHLRKNVLRDDLPGRFGHDRVDVHLAVHATEYSSRLTKRQEIQMLNS
jgi:hypothetical protein